MFNDVCANDENERVIPGPNQTFDDLYVYFNLRFPNKLELRPYGNQAEIFETF